MNTADVILTGLPRSGTTLVCKLLNELPDTVALHEPMDVTAFPAQARPAGTVAHIARFLEQNRRSLLRDGTAISKQVDGKIPANSFPERLGILGKRKERTFRGRIDVEKPLTTDFTLAIKHPVAFTALLEELSANFRVFALIRNPLSVLASWNSLDVPVSRGHAPAAENLDPRLREALAGTADRLDRQIQLLCWFLEAFRRHLGPEQLIRYEELVATQGKVLRKITPRAAELELELRNRNTNRVYDRELMKRAGALLLALGEDSPVWEFYTPADIERMIPNAS